MSSRQAINSLKALHEAMPEELKDKAIHRCAIRCSTHKSGLELMVFQRYERLASTIWCKRTASVPIRVWRQGRFSTRHARLRLSWHGYLIFPFFLFQRFGLKIFVVRVVFENDWLRRGIWPYRFYFDVGNIVYHDSCINCRRYSPTNCVASGRRSESWCHSWRSPRGQKFVDWGR